MPCPIRTACKWQAADGSGTTLTVVHAPGHWMLGVKEALIQDRSYSSVVWDPLPGWPHLLWQGT